MVDRNKICERKQKAERQLHYWSLKTEQLQKQLQEEKEKTQKLAEKVKMMLNVVFHQKIHCVP